MSGVFFNLNLLQIHFCNFLIHCAQKIENKIKFTDFLQTYMITMAEISIIDDRTGKFLRKK